MRSEEGEPQGCGQERGFDPGAEGRCVCPRARAWGEPGTRRLEVEVPLSHPQGSVSTCHGHRLPRRSPSSPPRTEKSFSKMAHFWTLCTPELASWFAASMPFWMAA